MARKLADGVWYLNLGLIPPFASNSFLVDDGDLTLVDVGLWWNRPSVRDELADAGYAVSDLDRVLDHPLRPGPRRRPGSASCRSSTAPSTSAARTTTSSGTTHTPNGPITRACSTA